MEKTYSLPPLLILIFTKKHRRLEFSMVVMPSTENCLKLYLGLVGRCWFIIICMGGLAIHPNSMELLIYVGMSTREQDSPLIRVIRLGPWLRDCCLKSEKKNISSKAMDYFNSNVFGCYRCYATVEGFVNAYIHIWDNL